MNKNQRLGFRLTDKDRNMVESLKKKYGEKISKIIRNLLIALYKGDIKYKEYED